MSELTDRELDALVAEKVAGWDAGAMLRTGNPKVPTAYSLPHYSTDILFAFRVVEKMRGLGWSFACTLYEGKLPYASFCKLTVASSRNAEAESLPRAICEAALAALSTVGEKGNQDSEVETKGRSQTTD